MHLTSSPVDWYAARAAGVVAYLLLSSVVLLGLTMSSKKTLSRWPRFTVEDVHRFGGLLVGTFIGIHVVTVAIDAWLPFSLGSILIPFTTRYRPIWVGLGVVAAELLLALAVTNHYRRRLQYRTWRRAHYLNFAVWTAASFHGIGSGTDRSSPWLLAVFAAATASVCAAIAWRVGRRSLGRRVLPVAGIAGIAVAALVVGLGRGPLQFRPKPWNAATFSETLTGHVAQLSGVTRGIVSLAGEGQGTQRVLVRADLLISTRKLLRTSFQMEYLPSGELCRGTVTSVHSTGFSAVCRLPSGAKRVVQAEWQLGDGAQVADGVITAHA
jgi:sulfoxide reductase heme-binding subunit YedZ